MPVVVLAYGGGRPRAALDLLAIFFTSKLGVCAYTGLLCCFTCESSKFMPLIQVSATAVTAVSVQGPQGLPLEVILGSVGEPLLPLTGQ